MRIPVLSDPAVDAVVLATSHWQHGEQIRRAAEQDVEKPFTLNGRDAKALWRRRSFSRWVSTALSPLDGGVAQRVRDGRLGVIESCIAGQTAAGGANIQLGAWRADSSETPAGAMAGIGIQSSL